jgi:hypothetical protein
MAAEQSKPRFEPPPWEREAFERFQQERQKARASEELDEQLRKVRQPQAPPLESLPEVRQEPKAEEQQPAIPEAKIDSMLIELRAEEPSVRTVHMPLINGVIAFLAVAGLAIIVQSALLFGNTGGAAAASKLLAAVMSLVLLLTGTAFLGGAFLLFRKYHR